MKTPAFNHAAKQWDTYKAFHNNLHGRWHGNGLFVLFESGEWMVTRGRLRPNERRTYDGFNVALTYTKDAHFQFTTPDGENVPTAWLTQGGSQALMVDLDTKRAYALATYYKHDGCVKDQLPAHAKQASLYVAGPKATPTTHHGIELARPDKAFTKENKAWMNDVRAVCTAKYRISGSTYYVPSYKYKLTDTALSMSVEEFCAQIRDADTNVIAVNGFQPRRVVTKVPFLIAK